VQRSNLYIILYTAALTVICGLLLSVTSIGLKPRQEENILLEQKTNILATVMPLDLSDKKGIASTYDKRVKSYVVDFNGKVIDGLKVTEVNIVDEYKKPQKERRLPVYEVLSETNPNQTDFIVLPVYGYGLWNNIWGFVSLKGDLSTINGVKFDHAGETPGLGARIATDEIQARYKGKQIFDNVNLTSVTMMKGENQDYSNDTHKVDGMSGATLTAKGVNNMLRDYLQSYLNFLNSKKTNSAS
jgi:Na+-transporting NADH:ubiquinone oxidoreductase subunit C